MSDFFLTYEEIKEILEYLNFSIKRTASSHQQWGGVVDNKFRLVTVDTNYNEYRGWVMSSMLHQSGVNKKKFISYSKTASKRYGVAFIGKGYK